MKRIADVIYVLDCFEKDTAKTERKDIRLATNRLALVLERLREEKRNAKHKNAANKPSHVTRGNVFDDLGLSPAEVAEAKVKADLWRDLVAHLEGLELTQKSLAFRLGVHQPDVSNLLGGKLSKFSVGTLIQYAVRLNLGIRVHLSAPKIRKGMSLKAQASAKNPKGRGVAAA